MAAELAKQLERAVSTQNEDALAECFSPDVEFRALVPPGLRERTGAREAASLFSQWLGDSTDLQLVDSSSQEVGDRVHISYRLAGVEEGEEYQVEHHLFCTFENGKIKRADLLCSGFQPRTP